MSNNMALARLPPLQQDDNDKIETSKFVGKSYKLGNNDLKYKLPPASIMKPYVDTQSGVLDTWPAHATNTKTVPLTMEMTRNKEFRVVNQEGCGKPAPVIPKPKFLDQLENYLKKELQALGVTEIGPSELRLQAHREIFEYLIEDFRTYRPLLSAIKNEYEMMLSYQRNVIRQMEPLKQMIVTVSEQCDQKIMNIRDEEKQEIKDLKAENSSLYEKIAKCNNEKLELQCQVEKLQDDLALQYLQYRDECDERKLLIGEFNNLQYEQEDNMKQNQLEAEEDDEEKQKNDPVFLKAALQQARKDEASASKRLNEMEANYGDVIPRRDMEKLSREHEELIKVHDELKGDFKKIMKEHETLQQIHKEAIHQRDEYYTEAETLRRSATPRPDWDSCADFVAGGSSRWKQISENKSSKQKVKVLLNEIAGAVADGNLNGAEYFDCLGNDELVPAYLRYSGQVRNRRLNKRDVSLLIKDIWRQKITKESDMEDSDESLSKQNKYNLADFVYEYLKSRFPAESMVFEWAYNLKDACERYSHDPKIGLFGMILKGEADENLYHLEYSILENIRGTLLKIDTENGGNGTVSKLDIADAIKAEFPNAADEHYDAILRASLLELNLPIDTVDGFDYGQLFTEDEEGTMSVFAEEIIKLLKIDRMDYVEEIKNEIKDENPVSIKALRKAFTTVDPEIDIEDILNYLCWTFKIPKDELRTIDESREAEIAMDFNKVVTRLQLGNIRRIGKK